MNVKIDPEFSSLMPPVENDSELEQEIVRDGKFHNAIIIWSHQRILLDGHRRWKIHLRHPKLPMPTPIVMHFESRQEAHDWAIRHQLSKRNVTKDQASYLRGKLYNSTKATVTNPDGANQYGEVGGQFVHQPKTAEALAKEHGVDERTIRRDGEFAENVDAIAEVAPELKDAILSGEVDASKADVGKAAALPKKKRKKVASKVKKGATIREALEQANIEEESEDKPEPTVAERCEADNKLIESFCRSLVKFYEDHVPHTAWTDAEGRSGSALASVKAACATLRAAKSVVCPCEGQDEKCAYCKGEGYLPKHKADQVARVA